MEFLEENCLDTDPTEKRHCHQEWYDALERFILVELLQQERQLRFLVLRLILGKV